MRALLIALVTLAVAGQVPAALNVPSVREPLGAVADPVEPALPSDAAAPSPDEALGTATDLAEGTPAEGILPPSPEAPPIGGFAPVAFPGLDADEGKDGFLAPLPPAAEAAVTSVAVGGALALAAFALYSRLGRGELLDHKRRDEVFQLVRNEPGISLSDVAAKTGLGWGTVNYHLDRLERGGFVTSERANGRRAYFPVGAVPKDDRASLGALRQDTTRNVASFVQERPGATQTELAEALGLTASAASKQVSKLESIGLVRREREHKLVRLHPGPNLASLLAPMQRALA